MPTYTRAANESVQTALLSIKNDERMAQKRINVRNKAMDLTDLI